MQHLSKAIRHSVGDMKRDLLFFDTIEIVGLHHLVLDNPNADPAVQADCRYLLDQEALVALPSQVVQLADMWSAEGFRRWGSDWGIEDAERDAQVLGVLASTARHPSSLGGYDLDAPVGIEIVVAYVERMMGDTTAVAVLNKPITASAWKRLGSAMLLPDDLLTDSPLQRQIVELVAGKLPVPDEEIPLEDVLAFARDDETRRRARSLRLWMATAAASGRTFDQLGLELDTMLHEFESHMKVVRSRDRFSTLRTIATVPLQVIEELIHMRPKGALNAVLSVSGRRANQLEAELATPGHEVALIDDAQRHFGGRTG